MEIFNSQDKDKYGIEIEFGSNLPIQVLCSSLKIRDSAELVNNRCMFFNIGNDPTADTDVYEGFELRTPIFYKFPYKKLNEYISKLKSLSFTSVHTRCGLHIHASGPSFIYLSLLSDEEFYKLCKKIYIKNQPYQQRSQFCSIDKYAFQACKKNRPIRKIADDHFEFRVFNSSFDLGYIFKCFQYVLSFREFCNGKYRT